jgi:hypothetical protein
MYVCTENMLPTPPARGEYRLVPFFFWGGGQGVHVTNGLRKKGKHWSKRKIEEKTKMVVKRVNLMQNGVRGTNTGKRVFEV